MMVLLHNAFKKAQESETAHLVYQVCGWVCETIYNDMNGDEEEQDDDVNEWFQRLM